MKTKIYVLLNEHEVVRYVGKTTTTLKTRITSHLWESRTGGNTHKCRWIRTMLARGLIPSVKILGEVDGDGSKEEIAWIAYFKQAGVSLTNLTDGGEGTCGWHLSDETKQKIGRANSIRLKGRKATPAQLRCLIKGRKNRQWPDSARKKASEVQTKIWNTPERRAERRIQTIGQRHSAATRLKMSIAKQNMSDETRRKISVAGMGRKASGKTKFKMSTSQLKRRLLEKQKVT